MNRLVLLPIVQDDVGYYLGFQNVVDEATVGAADISQGEINHMMNNPLSALLLSVELAIAEGKDVDKAIHECAEIFRRINTFCRHLDEPHLFSDYNPFRGESVDPG